MFTTEISESEDGTYTIEIPASEVDLGSIDPESAVRVGVYDPRNTSTDHDTTTGSNSQQEYGDSRTPPVEEGEVRPVTIENLGDKGDGIAKVETGFVIIVPGTSVGDELEVEIQRVNENFAIAEPCSETA